MLYVIQLLFFWIMVFTDTSLGFFVLDRDDSPITEVEPYIPFNINPAGMQPVLTTTYLLAFPSILARFASTTII